MSDFTEKESFELKGNELDTKIKELKTSYPYLNVCMQRYTPEIFIDKMYIIKIYHNNKCNTDVLVIRRKDE